MKAIFNDSGERVMIPDDLHVTQKVALLYPQVIKTLKIEIKKGILPVVVKINQMKLSSEEKRSLLYIVSNFRLLRKF